MKILRLLAGGFALVFASSLFAGAKPPAGGELFVFKDAADLAALKPDAGITASLADLKGAPAAKIEIPKLGGYPGVNFPVPAEGWDLSGFAGVQIAVHNPGTKPITVNLKAENKGEWKTSPWSIDMTTVPPGQTKMLKVTFGRNFGQTAFQLDPAAVTALRLYILPPPEPVSILVGRPEVFKAAPAPSATPAAVAAAPAPPPAPTPAVKPPPVFPPTPPLDLAGKHDFANASALNDEAASQLNGLCPLQEFLALPAADRHVYSFEVWPSAKDALDGASYSFNFHLGPEGALSQKVAFLSEDKKSVLTRAADPAGGRNILRGVGRLDWGGNAIHVFQFNKPVTAFGVVLRSSGDVALRKFFWAAARDLNGYPVSYTLADGSIVNLGQREVQAALIKGNTDAFLGVIDRSGRGIVSVTYALKGLAGNVSQSINLVALAFATRSQPATASVINLRGRCDFENPESLASTPDPAPPGLATLEDFRFIVGNHRFVYDFATWPQANPRLEAATGTFSFDLKGRGEIGQKIVVTATNAKNDAALAQIVLPDAEGQPGKVLGGLGDIGGGAWAEQTFKFEKPVWSFGATYRSPHDIKLTAVSYTLADGTKVDLDAKVPGVMTGKDGTFVGLRDKTDKGFASVTLRVQGTAAGPQPLSIGELAFALAGPPPGDWKLTLADEFNGDKLDPAIWTTGYTFPEVINNELQGFVPENVTVANGVCTIKVEHREAVNTDRTGRTGATQKFASGNFTSFDKFTQTYGYFEARIKMPRARGAGVWPAFWMLPDRGRDYPQKIRGSYRTADYGMGSEIDIFEFMPWWKTLDGRFRIHVGTIWSYGKVTPKDPAPHGYGSYALANDGWGPGELVYPNADGEFHTYGIYWSPERLIFYLDGKPIFRVKDPKNVPDVPEYFLFNISLSGNGWGASPDKKHPTMEQIIEDMPNQMEIDYFRAYSGTLEEAVPAPESDRPVIRKYTPPPAGAAEATPAPAPESNPPPTPAPAVPDAPVNSQILTPSNG